VRGLGLLLGVLLVAGCGARPDPPAPVAPAVAPARLTMAGNGSTVHLVRGQSLILALGSLDWTVTFSDPGILQRVPDAIVVAGQQGQYEAVAVGSTRLQATGRPICNPGQACPMFIVDFMAAVDVAPGQA